jgi:WD40 repeat protein
MPELVRRLRSELEWIPQKAMRKERQHRYQTALEFANDVRAYLDGRPITAAPESTGYRLRKYVRRNRALVAGGAAVFGTLVVGLGLATWQWAEANRARMAAESSEQLAIDEKAAADQARKAAEASESRALAERERRHDLLGVMSAAVALDALRWNDVNAVERELKALDDVGRADRFVARLLRAVRDSSVSVYGGGSGPCGVCLSPDGRRLASVTEDDTILMLDVLSGRPLCEPLRGHEGPISSLTFSPDGRFLASGSYDKTIRVWDGLTGKPVAEPLRGHQDWVTSVAFGPDSRILASGSSDATIRTWDVATGIPVREPLQGHEASVSSVAFCPLGRVLASGSEDETIRLWDASTGEPLDKPFHEAGGGVLEVSFSPDGQTLASTSADDSIRLWDMKTSELRVEPLTGHQDRVVSVTFSPDAQTLASASRDKTIRLWDASTGEPLGEPLRGHQDWITSVSFSLDGRMLVSAGFDDTIRLWDALKCETPGKIGQAISVCFSPDGRTLASTSDDTAIRLWDASTGMPLGEPLRGHERRIQSVSFSPDGRILASGSFDTIRLWDASTGKPWGKPLRSRGGDVSSVAFGPDSRTLAVADGGTLVELWDSWTGTTVGELESGGRGVSGRRGVDRVVFGRDGRTVLGLSEDAVQRWTIGEGQKPTAETRLSGGGGGVPELTHDESKFAQRGSDGSILLKDTWSDSQPPQLLRGHRGSIDSLCFSPDGQTIASAGGDQTVRLWDVPTGKPLGELPREQAGDVSSLCFSPDGQILAICSLDATMFLWHAVPMRDRVGAIRARLAQVDTIRAQLKAQIDAVGESTADCAAFQDAVLADPRFAGDLRTAALIVVGEVSQDREAKRAARSQQRDTAAPVKSKPTDTQPSEPRTTLPVP